MTTTLSTPRRAWRAGLVLTMLVVLLGFGAASAQAHSVTIFHPNEPTYATLYTDHTSMWVCDQDPDGHRAYIRFYIGGVLQPAVWDPDGYGGNCGVRPVNPATLDSFNVCVESEGCGTPVYRGSF